MVARNPLYEAATTKARSTPAYVTCPNCRHPAILRRVAPGMPFRCRQCNVFYRFGRPADSAGSLDRTADSEATSS
ncbi:MAG TPA: hypothetical protein VNT79_13620 [Phycisphaerae bacterium]|nr:hypothetical protein [Phycisphaerae bacterium]